MSATSFYRIFPQNSFTKFSTRTWTSMISSCGLVCTLWQSLIKLVYHRHKSTAPGLWLLPPKIDRKRQYCRIVNTL
ncbi:hypothetical protein SLEP1_g47566 [Rubroshorea leprosula]|uniref:Uncharacterized protein n=1 Tax=Rubroshorea leprosula TaxID=152421 RepID=A0AAV5LQW1_9ROSI|nr:hypothetical protein SLEP1_g47566 [Rubroshorea leprosula]